jgi:nucleotide-binding universal stress UspA family protein
VSWHSLGEGDPAGAVLTHAGAAEHTWLCLPTHARTAAGAKVFGSVAEAVVHEAAVPALVVGPKATVPDGPFTRVVAAVDRSDRAVAVIAAAQDLAERLGVRLVLVEVRPPDVVGATLDDGHLAASAPEGADSIVLAGNRPWAAIHELVGDDPTTVVVTGRRPAEAAGRFVSGSVAVGLARRLAGPVMIVPG